jgi:hypothetical protein
VSPPWDRLREEMQEHPKNMLLHQDGFRPEALCAPLLYRLPDLHLGFAVPERRSLLEESLLWS